MISSERISANEYRFSSDRIRETAMRLRTPPAYLGSSCVQKVRYRVILSDGTVIADTANGPSATRSAREYLKRREQLVKL